MFYIISHTIDFLFGVEALLKISAHGFIVGKNTYLRLLWNLMDFIIVCTIFMGEYFKPLRILRILRPLRVIKRVPELRKFTEALA